jgi:hypothetical protein
MRLTLIRSREFLTLFLAFLVLTSLVAWVVANPPTNEDFASISVLGSRMNTVSYFPNNITTVFLNEPIQWNVQVYNHMSTTQLFAVYIKLANVTATSPNATSNTPSGGSLLLQSHRAVLRNETWNLPLAWSVTSETSVSGTTKIQSMTINNALVPGIDLSAVGGTNFRIVIELWSYDVQTHSFLFSFMTRTGLNSVFNQIWFNTG